MNFDYIIHGTQRDIGRGTQKVTGDSREENQSVCRSRCSFFLFFPSSRRGMASNYWSSPSKIIRSPIALGLHTYRNCLIIAVAWSELRFGYNRLSIKLLLNSEMPHAPLHSRLTACVMRLSTGSHCRF